MMLTESARETACLLQAYAPEMRRGDQFPSGTHVRRRAFNCPPILPRPPEVLSPDSHFSSPGSELADTRYKSFALKRDTFGDSSRRVHQDETDLNTRKR